MVGHRRGSHRLESSQCQPDDLHNRQLPNRIWNDPEQLLSLASELYYSFNPGATIETAVESSNLWTEPHRLVGFEDCY